ncbi:unnamed protein product, partial [Staurois parvus]
MSLVTSLLTTCPVRGSVFHCVREAVYKWSSDPALPPSGRLYTTAGREVV